jgi:integrase
MRKHGDEKFKSNPVEQVVQERLGRSTISTTLDIYSHVTPGMQQQAVKIFDKILTRNSDKQRQLVTNTE